MRYELIRRYRNEPDREDSLLTTDDREDALSHARVHELWDRPECPQTVYLVYDHERNEWEYNGFHQFLRRWKKDNPDAKYEVHEIEEARQ